jgi:hypothetical protein
MDSLLRKEAVAARAGISTRMLETHFKNGTGPRRTFIGGRIYVAEKDCAAWILKQRRREGDPSEETAA